MTTKYFQARSQTNAATCTESKSKKRQILGSYCWRHRNIREYSSEKRARTVCPLKHKGGYCERILHRVVQSETGSSSVGNLNLKTDISSGQWVCSIVYINTCHKYYRFTIVLGILLIKFMSDFSLSVTLSA